MIDVNCNNVDSIEKFYQQKCVLVTGFTGFIGKVVVEKLLRSLDVRKVFVIVRAKKGMTGDERLQETLKSPCFHFHPVTESNLHKVQAVTGDLSEPKLGLSSEDYEMICREVTIVYHIAASVRFNANFRDSVRDNVIATQNIIDLCHRLEYCETLVHVSTAYSYCHLGEIEETLYPLKVSVQDALYMYYHLEDEPFESVMSHYMEGRPNSYTLTKALAENLVTEQRNKLTVAIVRPSIVCQAKAEPVPGWVDNMNGISGITMAASIGFVQTFNWNYYATVDLIPVDYVANGIISIAWFSALNERNNCKIYHLTSGTLNPITWGSFFEDAYEFTNRKPSLKLIRPFPKPPKHAKVPFYYKLQVLLYHYLFAYVFDFINSRFGSKETRKISAVRVTKKLHYAMDLFSHFTSNSWKFHNKNYLRVVAALNGAGPDAPSKESRKFDFDVRNIKWREYCAAFVQGNRQFLLKEDDSTLPKATRKLSFLRFMYKLVPLFFLLAGYIIILLLRTASYYIGNPFSTVISSVCSTIN